MEITQAGCCCTKNQLVQPQPFKSEFRFVGLSFNCVNRAAAVAAALPISILSSSIAKKPVDIHPQKALILTTCRSRRSRSRRRALLDDTSASSSPSDVEEVKRVAEPSLTLKKRAAEISPELKGTSVFLVGINSSIKSNLGKLLAEALRYYYFDSDELVEAAAGGKSTARLLIEHDEKGFRESETEVLKQLSSMGRLVVSAGNGAVQCAANLALLRHGISVWIDVPLDMVAREVVGDVHLPESELAISGSYSGVLAQLTELYERSRSGYTAADSTISLAKVASNLGYEHLAEVTVEDMALEVLKELQKLTRVKKMMEAAARPF